MKKKLGIFFMTLCFSLGLWCQASVVWAGNGKTSVSVSSNNVNIGDTVTVTVKCSGPSEEKANATMTLSYDSSILQFVNCSTTYGGGGGSVIATGESYTVTLKAIGAGSSNLAVSGNDGVLFDTNEELDSMSGTSAAVIVNNAAGSNSGNTTTAAKNNTADNNADNAGNADTTTNTDDNKKKSADNSLKSLTISPGTLFPEFLGSTVNYTATVPNDVTNIAVSAVPVNANAVVESVSGNEGLQVGTNSIKVVVKAENGVTATYTIQVTRQEEGAEPAATGESETVVSETEALVESTQTVPAESTEITEADNVDLQGTEDTSFEITYLQQEYNELSERYEKERSSFHTIIAILVFIVAILIIVIINLLIQRFRDSSDGDFFDDNDTKEFADDSDEEIAEEPQKKKSLFTKRSLFVDDDLENADDEELLEEEPTHRPQAKKVEREEKVAAPKRVEREEKVAAPKQVEREEKVAAPKQVEREEKVTAPRGTKDRSAVEADLDVIDFNDL